MPIAAKDVLKRVTDILQDSTSIRWTAQELVRYFNDGQREVIVYRPDALTASAAANLVAGSRQTLPADGAKLIEVVRNNTAGSKRAVRMVSRDILDAVVPNWHSQTGVTEILHFCFDPREPRVYYVYPPAATGAIVDILYAQNPTDIADPGAGVQVSAVTGNMALPDIFSSCLVDYILYRCYSKDADFGGNIDRAKAHYAAFTNAVATEVAGTKAVEPT